MRDVLLITLCLVSCGAPMPEDGQPGAAGAAGAQGPAGRDGRDAVQAGSRLKPLFWSGTDGTRAATFAFYDTERRERCFLQAMPGASDSMDRICAPLNFDPTKAGSYVRFTVE